MKNKNWRNLFSGRVVDLIRYSKEEYRKEPRVLESDLALLGTDGAGIIVKLADLLDELAEHGQVQRVIEFLVICHNKEKVVTLEDVEP